MSDIPNILIVDDEPTICNYLQKLLSKKHYQVATADSGREALKKVDQNSYDLVLLDLILPDLKGYQVMDYIKCQSPETLVIIITGYATIESAIEALRKGAYDYIRKPIEKEDLLKTTANALDYKRLIINRKLSEIALQESEERFRNLVENSLIGISIIQNNNIIYQNPEQHNLFGGLSDSFEISDFKYIHSDDITKVKKAYESILSGNAQSVQIDFRFSPSGKFGDRTYMRWVQCRASVFKYLGEDAILVNMMDITRPKELEHLVMIKHKMASLGRVAAGIAHEIRNPLTGINSYLFTLEDLCDADTFKPDNLPMMKQISGQIQVASNKIESVVKRVLDFSKPNRPKMAKIDLNQSLLEAINLSSVTLRKMGIRVETSLAENLPNCYGDAHLIEQVILNLINNATRAINKDDNVKMIKITSYSANQSLIICIADSGRGVPIKLRDKIFDPFFTTYPDGYGIGLSIAQRIVTDHNGTIRVGTSKLGGAEFSIDLPAEKRMNPR